MHAAARGDEAEDAHRLGPLAGLGEQAHDQRQRHRGDDRAAEALHRPRAISKLCECARPQPSEAR